MRAEELAQLIRRKPFQALRLHLTTGQTYDIRHPEFIIVQRQSAEVGLDPDPKTGVVDRVEYLSLLHIVRIENIESPIGPVKGNGEGMP
jgi:hypothetical protein